MPLKEEIVAEVRSNRDAYAARFDYDLERICEDLKKKEKHRPSPASKTEARQTARILGGAGPRPAEAILMVDTSPLVSFCPHGFAMPSLRSKHTG
ncbi:MAG TPA: hypothetical protein VMB85_03935 [Bryobacteraceae bacterium]|nr:hypothetical protein [Bryobacteraceae bacterium]